MKNGTYILNARCQLVTRSGLIDALLSEDGNTLLCPDCKQPPFLSEVPTELNVFLICPTWGCKNYMMDCRPNEYLAAKEKT